MRKNSEKKDFFLTKTQASQHETIKFSFPFLIQCVLLGSYADGFFSSCYLCRRLYSSYNNTETIYEFSGNTQQFIFLRNKIYFFCPLVNLGIHSQSTEISVMVFLPCYRSYPTIFVNTIQKIQVSPTRCSERTKAFEITIYSFCLAKLLKFYLTSDCSCNFQKI